MKRRDLLKNTALGSLGLGFVNSCASSTVIFDDVSPSKTTKNIIFMVSDGMSQGTFAMADSLSKRQFGKQSAWLNLNLDSRAKRALMETFSANSLVTDFAKISKTRQGSGLCYYSANYPRNASIFQCLQ
jgi:alkaline phosphatase